MTPEQILEIKRKAAAAASLPGGGLTTPSIPRPENRALEHNKIMQDLDRQIRREKSHNNRLMRDPIPNINQYREESLPQSGAVLGHFGQGVGDVYSAPGSAEEQSRPHQTAINPNALTNSRFTGPFPPGEGLANQLIPTELKRRMDMAKGSNAGRPTSNPPPRNEATEIVTQEVAKANALDTNQAGALRNYLTGKEKESEEAGIKPEWWAMMIAGFAMAAAPPGQSAAAAIGQGGLAGAEAFMALKQQKRTQARERLNDNMAQMKFLSEFHAMWTPESQREAMKDIPNGGELNYSALRPRAPAPTEKERIYGDYIRATAIINQLDPLRAENALPPELEQEYQWAIGMKQAFEVDNKYDLLTSIAVGGLGGGSGSSGSGGSETKYGNAITDAVFPQS